MVRNDLNRPRLGRPPKDMAGDVKARILDAAQRGVPQERLSERKR